MSFLLDKNLANVLATIALKDEIKKRAYGNTFAPGGYTPTPGAGTSIPVTPGTPGSPISGTGGFPPPEPRGQGPQLTAPPISMGPAAPGPVAAGPAPTTPVPTGFAGYPTQVTDPSGSNRTAESDALMKQYMQKSMSPDFYKHLNNSYRLAKAHIVNLQRQVDPKSAPPAFKGIPLGIDPSAPSPVANVNDLRTLGDFIRWAAVNKLTWDGKRFAWNTNEKAEATQAGALVFTSYPKNRQERDPVSRDAAKLEVYALKEPLKGYLSYLRDNDARKNKVLEVMLKAMIEELNTKLPGEPMASKATPGTEAIDLDPNMLVDAFPSDILDPDNWQDGLNRAPTFMGIPNQLLIKDLMSQPDFLNWLKGFKLKTRKGNVPVLDPGVDVCAAIHMLYKRAQYLNTVVAKSDTSVANYDKATDFYVKSIQKYGSQLNGLDGKPCAVTGPGTVGGGTETGTGGTGTGTGAGGTGGRGAGAGGAGTGGPDAGGAGGRGYSQQMLLNIEKVVDLLPLKRDVISFTAIEQFIDAVSNVMEDNQVQKYRSMIEDHINACNRMTKITDLDMNLSESPQQIATELIKPSSMYCNYIKQLQNVVTATMKLIRAFKNKFGNPDNPNAPLTRNKTLYQKVIAQVGTYETDSYSIGQMNYNRLQYLSSPYCSGIRGLKFEKG